MVQYVNVRFNLYKGALNALKLCCTCGQSKLLTKYEHFSVFALARVCLVVFACHPAHKIFTFRHSRKKSNLICQN